MPVAVPLRAGVLQAFDLESACPRNPLAPPLFCLPLYSLLSSKKQQRIFEPVPDGHRLVVFFAVLS